MLNKEKIVEYLIHNYPSKSKKEILSELNLSWSYIQKLACINKIKKGKNESGNDSKYQKLIDYNDNITLYWIGFIIADGHLYRKSNIQINISLRDKEHLLKINKHIGHTPFILTKNSIRMTISDRTTIDKLSSDFNLVSNKTKNPISIPDFLSDDGIFSLIVGFIDGDGTINKKGHLFIKCDESWKEILEKFYYKLTGEFREFKLTSDNLSIIYILKLKQLISIKRKAQSLNLPIMERKWNRIEDRILKEDKFNIILKLINNGHTVSDLIKKGEFSQSLIYKVYNSLKK